MAPRSFLRPELRPGRGEAAHTAWANTAAMLIYQVPMAKPRDPLSVGRNGHDRSPKPQSPLIEQEFLPSFTGLCLMR